MRWPDTRLLDLFGIDLPIILAPMANFAGVEMAIAVAEAGGLGSLPCATLSPDKIRASVAEFRSRSNKPLSVNFFCHTLAADDLMRDRAWLDRVAPYYAELGVELPVLPLPAGHAPFGQAECAIIEELSPEIVSVQDCRKPLFSIASGRQDARWSARRRRCVRPAFSPSTTSTPSSRKVRRPMATAACSSSQISRRRSAPSPSCEPFLLP